MRPIYIWLFIDIILLIVFEIFRLVLLHQTDVALGQKVVFVGFHRGHMQTPPVVGSGATAAGEALVPRHPDRRTVGILGGKNIIYFQNKIQTFTVLIKYL